MSPVHRYGIAALVLSVGVAVVPGARAASPPPPPPQSDSAALSVYVESVPTTQGPKPFWGLPSAHRSSLPRAARRRIDARGGADAGTLGRIQATAPALTRVEGGGVGSAVGATGRHEGGAGGAPTTFRSSARAAAGPALRQHRTALAAVVLATLALLIAAARRRREESPTASASTGDAREESGQIVAAE